ncbi:MAG: SPFH domain-containing protein, partial [Eggerthellaceae bacterium]|nr:SPFH domain-containing protein [Eggerthellaceae bacterium]
MGLIKAITGAAGGVLADSWRDFYYCDSDVLNENVLAAKGQKRTSDKGRSSNTKGESNIISDGSIIAVNDGQCMIIVESGEIVDVCAEPGQFVYDRSTEPSIFYGSLGEGIKNTFERIGQRFTFGGDTGKDQRVYFFNTKEIIGNKYGTSSPIPFRIVDANLGLDMDTSVRMNGEYSYRLTDPLIFYKKVCGNVEEPYTRDRLDSQMKSELLTALQPALARISEMGVRYSAIPAHTAELAKLLNDELSEDWGAQRGIQVEKFGVNSITLPEEVQQQIANRQMAQTMVDPSQAAAVTANAAANAMQDAANNSAGAMTGFMGMGMAQGMGGQAAATMFQQGAAQQGAYQQPQSAYPMADGGGFGAQPFQQQQQ